jgi:cytochrome c
MRKLDSTADAIARRQAGGRLQIEAGPGRVRLLAIGALALLTGSLCLGFIHPYGDPRAESATGLRRILTAAGLPTGARSVLMGKCADCHSGETHWPAYAHFAPGSWLMEWDVMEGRRHLNLSEWNQLPPGQREQLVARIILEARSGQMPPLKYVALHWRSRITPADLLALASLNDGVTETSATGSGDAARGKQVFEHRCAGCHAIAANREGPQMAGVYGRRAGSVPHFDYSSALKKSGLTWTDANLDKWLADPDELVPGNNMEFRVSKAEERRDLIAYLKQ